MCPSVWFFTSSITSNNSRNDQTETPIKRVGVKILPTVQLRYNAFKSANGLVHHDEQVPHVCRSYFDDLLNCKRDVKSRVWVSFPKTDKATTYSMAFNDPPTFQEVCLATSCLEKHKAAGYEWCIKPEGLKHRGTVLAMELHQLIIKVWNSESISDYWWQAGLIYMPEVSETLTSWN